MPYPFLGTSGRIYSQFLDGATGKTLCAEPGGLYDVVLASGCEGMAVPPADGLWGSEQDPPKTAATTTKAAPKGRTGSSAATAAKGD